MCQWVDAFHSILSITLDQLAGSQWGRWKGGKGCFEGSAKLIIRLASPPGPPTAYAGPRGRWVGSAAQWAEDSWGHIEADVSSARYHPCCLIIFLFRLGEEVEIYNLQFPRRSTSALTSFWTRKFKSHKLLNLLHESWSAEFEHSRAHSEVS